MEILQAEKHQMLIELILLDFLEASENGNLSEVNISNIGHNLDEIIITMHYFCA